MNNDINPQKIPQIIRYKKIELEKGKRKPDEFLNKIVLEIQGKAIELNEFDNLPWILITAALAYKLCPEVVLKLKTGESFLIFGRQDELIVRPKEIDARLLQFVLIAKKKKSGKELVLPLENYFDKKSDSTIVEKIQDGLEKISEDLFPAQICTIIGKGSALFFVLIIKLLRGLVGELWYQPAEKIKSVRIF